MLGSSDPLSALLICNSSCSLWFPLPSGSSGPYLSKQTVGFLCWKVQRGKKPCQDAAHSRAVRLGKKQLQKLQGCTVELLDLL
eukprot:6189955-Pleurochrysis_carterae.AAC.8